MVTLPTFYSLIVISLYSVVLYSLYRRDQEKRRIERPRINQLAARQETDVIDTRWQWSAIASVFNILTCIVAVATLAIHKH